MLYRQFKQLLVDAMYRLPVIVQKCVVQVGNQEFIFMGIRQHHPQALYT